MRKIAALLLLCTLCHLTHAQTRSLEDFLKAATANNPQAADFSNQLQAARYDSLILRASFRPHVSVEGKILAAPTINGWGYDENIVNPNEYTLVGSVTQDILLGKNRNIQYRSLSASTNLIAINAGLSLRELKKTITDQYLAAWTHYNQMKFAYTMWELLQRSQEILKPMVDKGVYRATDYLAFTIETQGQQLEAAQLRFQYKTDLDSLNLMCGIMDTSLYDLAPPIIQPILGTGTFVLTPRFLADSLRLTAERDLLSLRYRPRFGWFADAGLNALHIDNAYRNLGTSFGVTLSIPLYDGGVRSFENKKLDLQENLRRQYSSYYHSQYALRTMQLQQDIAMNEKLLKQYREQLKLSQALIDISEKQLNKGEMSVMEFINALRGYKTVQAQVSEAEMKQAELVGELNFLNDH